MPIKKGNTTIGAIYKGTTPIGRIYKGTTLIFESGTWENWYQEFIYNALIPTTINSKQVKNKAKVDTIYGNSVVENQLNNFIYDNPNSSEWSLVVDGEKYTLTATADNSKRNALSKNAVIKLIGGHKYIWLWDIKSSKAMTLELVLSNATTLSSMDSVSANILTKACFVFSMSADTTATLYLNRNTGGVNFVIGDTIEISDVMIIDLTQMFPIDTPTTLTDTRVQALLNRGYIAYNSGEIKSVSLSEISSTKSDTTALQTLSFKYQGNGVGTAHDTLEITSSAYVFTKNMGSVDLSTLSWTYQSDNARFVSDSLTGKLSSISSGSTIGNIMCNKYLTIMFNGSSSEDKVIYQYITQQSYNRIMIKDSSLNGDTTQISGTLYYGLLTPQVITIPKKHLGYVDLGTLGLSLSAGYWRGQVNNINSPSATSMPNIYCNSYQNDTYAHLQSDGYIAISGSGYVYIKDSSKTQASDFAGIYLFYETQDEVADIPVSIDIQAGGTITTDSNVLPNIEFNVKCK